MQSPLEERFAHFATKFLDRRTELQAQHQVRTTLGVFRLDFRLVGPDGEPAIGIECDGAAFHHRIQDAWRDAAILGESAVRDIVRIEGKDLHRRPHDVLFLIARLYPTLFSARGLEVLARLASVEARESEGPLPDFVYFAPEIEIDDEAMFDDQQSFEPAGYVDFLHLAIAGRSRHASSGWRFRHASALAEPLVTIAEWVRREEVAIGG